MSYTKKEFIVAAYEEIGLASYVFDLQSEDLQMALRRLDSMMAQWNAAGIRLGYPIPSSPSGSSLTEDTDVPDSANEAIITNLAIKIAPSFGRMVAPETKITAAIGYHRLLARAAMPTQQKMPSTMPAGAGNKTWRIYDDPFLRGPTQTVDVGSDSELEF